MSGEYICEARQQAVQFLGALPMSEPEARGPKETKIFRTASVSLAL
jgi:hypothetical protein